MTILHPKWLEHGTGKGCCNASCSLRDFHPSRQHVESGGLEKFPWRKCHSGPWAPKRSSCTYPTNFAQWDVYRVSLVKGDLLLVIAIRSVSLRWPHSSSKQAGSYKNIYIRRHCEHFGLWPVCPVVQKCLQVTRHASAACFSMPRPTYPAQRMISTKQIKTLDASLVHAFV